MSILAPIFLTTLVTIISSLLKFKKFPEKMESNTKAAEKCYFAIIRIRQLIENLNFQDEVVSKNAYNTEVMVYYRDALDSIERTMYPKQRTALFLQAQQNLMTIHKNEYNYNNDAHKVKTKMVDLEEKKLELNKRERSLYDEEKMLDALSNASTPSNFSIPINTSKVDAGGCCGSDIETGHPHGGGAPPNSNNFDDISHDELSDDNTHNIPSNTLIFTPSQVNNDYIPSTKINLDNISSLPTNTSTDPSYNTNSLSNSQKKKLKKMRQKAKKAAAITIPSNNTFLTDKEPEPENS